jgi:tetratricopeptide (TPR) repeat protein
LDTNPTTLPEGARACRTQELLPGNVPVLSNRAKCYLKLNKFAKAEDDADVVLLIDPEFVKAYHSRGIAKANLGLKTEALQDLRKVLKV